jgi:hypothetical protein
MVTFLIRPVTFPGYVFSSNTGDDTGIQLALSIDTRVGIEEYIASGQAGKLNRTKHHLMPYSVVFQFNWPLNFYSHPISATSYFIGSYPFAVVQSQMVAQRHPDPLPFALPHLIPSFS